MAIISHYVNTGSQKEWDKCKELDRMMSWEPRIFIPHEVTHWGLDWGLYFLYSSFCIILFHNLNECDVSHGNIGNFISERPSPQITHA